MTFERTRPETCLSDLMLERLRDGELSGEAKATAQAHLQGCAPCTARVAELERAHLELQPLISIPSLVEKTEHRVRAQVVRPPRWKLRTGVGAALALAASLLVYLNVREGLVPANEYDGRLKGNGFALGLVVKPKAGGLERPSPGAKLSPGDELRFVISSALPGYVAVLSIDAAGKVTLFHTAELAAGKGQLQPGGVLLDEVLGAERLVAVRCKAKQSDGVFEAAAKQALERAGGDVRKVGPLQLEGCIEDAFPIEKVASQ